MRAPAHLRPDRVPGREHQYRAAENALRFRFNETCYWKIWKIVKQCAIVITRNSATDVRDVLTQHLGGRANILVLRLRHGYALTLRNAAFRAAAADCLDGIPRL